MSGLVGYHSSDDDDHFMVTTPKGSTQNETRHPVSQGNISHHLIAYSIDRSQAAVTESDSKAIKASTSLPLPSIGPQLQSTNPASFQGHSLGPAAPMSNSSISSFPHRETRFMVQQLTLPIHANLDIPPSPPTSPYPGLDPKISHFITLKHSGVHFNAKLATSSALKNPSLMSNLLQSAELHGQGAQEQYASMLSIDLWNPHGFPRNVLMGGFMKMQQEADRRGKKARIGAERDFVAARTSRNG